MRIVLSREIISRLNDLHDYILSESKNEDVADDAISEMLDGLSILESFPFVGVELDGEDVPSKGIRYILISSHVFLYEVDGNTVFVSNLVDTRTKEWAKLQGKHVSEDERLIASSTGRSGTSTVSR